MPHPVLPGPAVVPGIRAVRATAREPGLLPGIANVEMGRALYRIESVQIVRQDAGLKKLSLSRARAADSSLTPRRMTLWLSNVAPARRSLCAAAATSRVDLVGMVDMQHDNLLQRAGLEPVQQSGIDALWNHHRQPAVDPQPTDVGDPGRRSAISANRRSLTASGSPPLKITSLMSVSVAR